MQKEKEGGEEVGEEEGLWQISSGPKPERLISMVVSTPNIMPEE